MARLFRLITDLYLSGCIARIGMLMPFLLLQPAGNLFPVRIALRGMRMSHICVTAHQNPVCSVAFSGMFMRFPGFQAADQLSVCVPAELIVRMDVFILLSIPAHDFPCFIPAGLCMMMNAEGAPVYRLFRSADQAILITGIVMNVLLQPADDLLFVFCMYRGSKDGSGIGEEHGEHDEKRCDFSKQSAFP